MAAETDEHDRPGGRAYPPVDESAGRAFLHFLMAAVRGFFHGVRRLRSWNRRGGAGRSGLAGLIELHALQAAGDAVVAVALAGTIFFGASTSEARGRVALYLLITMAPFAVVAPLLGPLLDRFAHGRRFALAVTMIARAVLAVALGHALGGGIDQLALFPAALGVLIAGKAYSVCRSSAVPRLLPDGMTLVQANSRLTVAAVVSPAIAGLIAIGLTKLFGHQMSLRFGAVLYVVAAVLSARLPRTADGGRATTAVEHAAGRGLLRLTNVHADVGSALRATAALRWLSGFLLLYGAFVLRDHRLSGLSHNLSLAVLAIGIGVGNLLGTTVGARVAGRPTKYLAPPLLVTSVAVTLFAAIDFGLVSVTVLAVGSAATAAMAKLSLDGTIQQRVNDDVRTSTFARSEATLQLAWVAGGAIGIVLPTEPIVGFLVASLVMAAVVANAYGVALRPLLRRMVRARAR